MLERNIKILTWFNFFVDFRLFAPIAIIYFSQVTHSFALGMSVFGMIQLSQAVFEVPTGIFSDFLGRKKTVIIGAIFATFAMVFYSLGISWTLFLGAILEGVSRSFYSGNNDALLHESLAQEGREDEYHTYFGKISSMFQIALGISGLVGGFIAFYSFHLVFWLSVIPQMICVLLALKLIEPKVIKKQTSNVYAHLKEAIILIVKNPKLRLLSLADIWGYGLGESGFQFRSAFINTIWPVWAIGIPQVISNIGATIGFYYSGKVIKKFGAAKILFFSFIPDKLLDFTALIFVSIFSPILLAVTSFNFGLSGTASSSLMQKEFTNEQRATLSSLTSLGASLFFAVVAFLIGAVADRFNPAQALLILEVFKLLNVYLYWKLFKHK